MMYAAVCGCSSHPAVTLQVDGSRCLWPIRSSQGVPAAGWLDILCLWSHSLIHHRLSLRFGVYGSLPVSLHCDLSPMQFPVVVLVHWTPSAFLPFGSVLACAVPAVFYTPDSGC